jgi:hypothetical protein
LESTGLLVAKQEAIMRGLHLSGVAAICLGIVFSVELVWTIAYGLGEPARADSLTTTALSVAAGHTQHLALGEALWN